MRYLIIKSFFVVSFIIGYSSQNYAANIDSLYNSLNSEIAEDNFNTLFLISKHYSLSNPDTAYYYSHKAYIIADFLNDDVLLARALYKDATNLYYMNEKRNAIKVYEEYLTVLKKLGNNETPSKIYLYIALMYRQFGEFDLASHNYRKSLEFAVLDGDISDQIEALKGIGIVYVRLSKFDDALKYYFKALKLAQNNNLKRNEGGLLNNIGTVYKEIKNEDLALNYYLKALAIRLNLKDSAGMSGTYNNIGIIYKNKQQYDSALVYYQTAYKINKAILFWRYAATNLSNIGILYKRMGEYEKALDYSFQALKMEKELKLTGKFSSSYSRIGNVYLLLNQFSKAMEYFQLSLNDAKKLNKISNIEKAYMDIHLVYVEIGDHERALENFKIHKLYQDSILDETMQKSIVEIQTRYKTEEKEKENQILKKDKETSRTVRLYLILMSVSLGIVLIFLVYFFIQKSKLLKRNKQYYEKEKQLNRALKKTSEVEKKRFEEIVYAEQKINELQNDKIVAKNKELSAVVLSDHNKNRILNELSKEIEIIEQQSDFGKQSLRKFKLLVSGTQMIEDDWLTFKEQIEKVYHGFFAKLYKYYPSLTIHEQRLCSYLLIDMSSKEIANLLNVSVAAVNKSRQRLRKKLNLESDIDFSTFLRQL